MNNFYLYSANLWPACNSLLNLCHLVANTPLKMHICYVHMILKYTIKYVVNRV